MNLTIRGDEVSIWGVGIKCGALRRRVGVDARDDRVRYGVLKWRCVVVLIDDEGIWKKR